jgi:hypothetical protein
METFDVVFADKLELVIPLVKFVLASSSGLLGARCSPPAAQRWRRRAARRAPRPRRGR